MKTQIELARESIITEQVKQISADEGLFPEILRQRVACGEIVILGHSKRKNQKVVGIGKGLRTKVNASIGTSSDICDIDAEVRKAKVAEEEGADTLMELSASGVLDAIRRAMLAGTDLPVGNVSLYQAFKETTAKYANSGKLDPEYLFDLICYITPAEHLALPNEGCARRGSGNPPCCQNRRCGKVSGTAG